MPGDSGVTVVTNACAYYTHSRAAAGAPSARHSLRPLTERAEVQANSGQLRGEIAKLCLPSFEKSNRENLLFDVEGARWTVERTSA